MLLDQSVLKERLYRNKQVYLDCANALLVGAALIAGVAFQGWLQPPLGYSLRYQDGSSYADVQHKAVRLFWWFNNGAFFLSVVALIAGAKGATPAVEEAAIAESLINVKRAVAVASVVLGMALVCVVVAFTAAGFAVLPPVPHDLHIMQTSIAWGGTACTIALLWFFASVWPFVGRTSMQGLLLHFDRLRSTFQDSQQKATSLKFSSLNYLLAYVLICPMFLLAFLIQIAL